MIKPWKLVLLLSGIFVAGGVSGAFLAKRFALEWIGKRPGPEQWAPNHLKRLVDNLDLPAEQAEQIRPIIRRNMAEMNKLRDNMVAESKVIMERMQHEVSEKLTPEQRARYEQMNKELREKLKKLNLEKAARPAGPGGPRPDGAQNPNGPGKRTAVPQ